jgi:hypothetical protein
MRVRPPSRPSRLGPSERSEVPPGRGAVLRLFSFSAVRPGFDEILRTRLVPDLRQQPGVGDVYTGRQGPDEVGPRIVASTWERRQDMDDAVGPDLGLFHPELLDETAERTLEVLALVIAERYDVAGSPTILRLLRGRVRREELETYIEDVRSGAGLDAESDHGPVALYLATDGVDAFVTMSAWRSWQDIEWATGGDVHRPRATRHPERLITWDVDHYELIRIG